METRVPLKTKEVAMRRLEGLRTHGLTADLSIKLTSLSAPVHERGLSPEPTPGDDLSEGHGLNWEAAWIDLGGEG
jgi:hypothetical protein